MIVLWFLLIFLFGFTCGVWLVFKALNRYVNDKAKEQQEAEAQAQTRAIIQKAINQMAQSN
jgi:cbb3-type cytochrome oxidase subunit 3